MGVSLGVAAVAGTGISAYGQYQSGKAEKNAAEYNAQIAEQNAEIATQKAKWATQIGEQDVSQSQLKTRAEIGGIEANQGASGVRIDSGSSQDVRQSAREMGMLDALTIRSNAARQAYGYMTEEASDKAQAKLDRYAGKSAETAGKIKAATTLIGGAGDTYSNFIGSKSIF